MGETISVLLASSNPTLRFGLRTILEQEPNISVTGESEDGKEALAQIELLRPNVALLDYLLTRLSAVEVAEEVRRRGFQTRIVVFLDHSDEKTVYRMVVAGVAGCLMVDDAPENIVVAIRAARRGEVWFSPSVANQLVSYMRNGESRRPNFTTRELAVLRLVSEGKSNKEIAQKLKISTRTVEYYVGNVLGRLGVASRVEAAVWAKEHDLDLKR